MLLKIRRDLTAIVLLLASLIIWLLLINPANALSQEPSIEQDKPPEQVFLTPFALDPSSISSEKVSQFVSACLQVVALIEHREGELQGAETESESLRIEQEIEAEALATIEKTGLTRQEYLQLLGLANTDPEFGERIAAQLQEATS